MTGYSEEYAHERFPDERGIHFLKKPFTIESLRETLRDALGPSSPE